MRPERRVRSLAGENIRMALTTVWTQKLRSGLTLLGIIIGVATVIAMVSMIQGLNNSVSRQIGSLGTGVLFISKYEAGIHVGGMEQRKPRKDLTIEDAEAIRHSCPAVAAVSPEISAMWKVSYGGVETKSITINGGTTDFFTAGNWGILRGRALTDDDVRHSAAVCVIGSGVADLLFPTGGDLGSHVRVGNGEYLVVGVLTSKGKFFGQDQDQLVVLPITRVARALGYGRTVDYILAQPKSPRLAESAKEQVEELLRRRRGVRADQPNDFGITSQENLMQIYKQVTQGFYLVMVLISSIGLMVGGIGVMNMMLVSVRERTREIGLRMAVGCRRRDVLGQFLIEAALLTAVGGVVGIIVGQGLAFILSKIFPVPSAVSIPWIIIAVTGSASIGLFFGMFPAWRASRLDPVEALRYE